MKYELDQMIYYMCDNRPHSAPVLSRQVVENLHSDWTSNTAQESTFAPFGQDCEMYNTCHGTVTVEEAFPSKYEMLLHFLNGNDDKSDLDRIPSLEEMEHINAVMTLADKITYAMLPAAEKEYVAELITLCRKYDDAG